MAEELDVDSLLDALEEEVESEARGSPAKESLVKTRIKEIKEAPYAPAPT